MKILIIQIKQLGDVLLSTSVAEAVKRYIPNAEVHFLTSVSAAGVVANNPNIDKVVLIKNSILDELKVLSFIRKEKYNAILDIQRTARSKRLTFFSRAKVKAAFRSKDNIFYNKLVEQTTTGYTAFERLDILKAVGIEKSERFMPRLFFDRASKMVVESYLKKNSIERFFIVSPTARKKTKMWQAEEFGKLANKLSKEFDLVALVVYGSQQEKHIAERCLSFIENGHLIERVFSIKEFAALASMAEFSLGNDSFASHVAVSQGIKTIVICGPTSGWFLENDSTLLIYKGLRCQPCNNPKACPYSFACYKLLRHEEIELKVMEFLKGR